jgi:hypothetical protein
MLVRFVDGREETGRRRDTFLYMGVNVFKLNQIKLEEKKIMVHSNSFC